MFGLHHSNVKILGLAGVLASALLMSPFLTRTASAEIRLCRTDPILTLSNGMALDLTASISDSSQDVKQITYTVHIPSGVSVTSTLYTPGPLAKIESLKVVADDVAGTYDTSTLVTTGTNSVPTTATTALVNASTAVSLGFGSASGTSGQALSVQLVSSN